MDADTLTTSVDGPIGRLTLNRPDKLNPLSTQCLDELAAAAGWFDDQPDVRVVIVTGAGRAFSAGADLAGFGGHGGGGQGGSAGSETRSPRDAVDAGRVMVESIERMRAVTIAAIHGHCIGGGVLLAMACDLRVAAESTNFVIPEVDLGIPLTWGGIPRLVREIGAPATRDLVLSCRPFTATEAHERGIANRMVADEDLNAEVETLAALLAGKSAYTLHATLDAVDAAAEALVPTNGAWSDADQWITAMRDPESRDVAARYLAERGR
ncbi:MAG: enoyl-CoA hydratase/isomerase family protein [Acidimicrobiales bacterium]|jgi:enoyl-CoA hydratase/carnithine racemase|nr:enoyl-CoA hydratase/isomerase family protein [Acidimicrobiales bacterium]